MGEIIPRRSACVLLIVCRRIVITGHIYFVMKLERSNKGARLRRVFAEQMRARRQQQGLSQEQLASRAGLHRTYIGSVERAERNVSIDNIERIAAALGCAPAELLRTGSR